MVFRKSFIFGLSIFLLLIGVLIFPKIASASETPITTMSGLPMRMSIDTPAERSVVRGTTTISGWALNDVGISKVEILIGGRVVDIASIGLSRPDVNSTFPGYPGGSQSGYSYSLNTTIFANGLLTVGVKATGINGEQIIYYRTVNVDNTPKLNLDTPGNGNIISGTVPISGWALHSMGISAVYILRDDWSYLGTATIGLSRPDVNAAFPGYTGGSQSGFLYSLDTTRLTNGIRTLKVVATGANGQQFFSNIVVNVSNAPMRLAVDSFGSLSTLRGQAMVSGWAINASGIARVDVLIGNKVIGIANIGQSRPDIASNFSGYTGAGQSGYSFSLNTNNLTNGLQVIGFRAVGNNGEQITCNVPVYIDNTPKMSIDSPGYGISIKGGKILTITGWAVNPNGVAKVEVLIDNIVVDVANTGISRPDVAIIFPGCVGGNLSGYLYNLNTSYLSYGAHWIGIRATGFDGQQSLQSIFVNIAKRLIVIDPGHGGTDPGAIANGVRECDVNLGVGLKLRDLLIARGYDVLLTRTSDVTVSLDSRVNLSNTSGGDIYISLHANSTTDPNITGVLGTYYATDQPPDYYGSAQAKANAPLSIDLANKVANSVAVATGQGQKPSEDHCFYVSRYNNLPSTLVEMGFLTNPQSAAAIATSGWQSVAAKAIADGIGGYFVAHP